jgi:type I restriction enzyme M protein
VGIFQGLSLGDNRVDDDDLLGDAYEYLMRHFATESGKSKGQFYTPAEVSRVVAKVVGIEKTTEQDKTVYDPTCGSGSLLLKAAAEAPRGLSIFGQEMDNTTHALARMNMILHDNVSAPIWQDNTLSTPQWKNKDGGLQTFDFAVANPPFSSKNWTNGINVSDKTGLIEDSYKRFEFGTPPEKNGDYAFLLHILKSLNNATGKGAVILPHGVLFRGNAEAVIRENLIKQGFIKGIIGLPANLFYGTGIPACIIVLDKEHANARKGIFMIDASKGFIKDGNKNRLREQDIHKIVDVYNNQLQIDGFSAMVKTADIATNDYNLNIPRYIDASETEDLHDLGAHLSGGVPQHDIDALARFWQVMPGLKASLFKAERPGYAAPLVEANEVKNTILTHPEF